jgi:hypothetical protein
LLRLQATGGNAAVLRLQLIEDMALAGPQIMNDLDQAAEDQVKGFKGNPAGLAIVLLNDMADWGSDERTWERSQIAHRILDKPGATAVMIEMAKRCDAARLTRLAANSAAKSLLLDLASGLRTINQVEEAERIVGVLISPAHGHLLGEQPARGAEVAGALGSHGASIQSVVKGVGPVVYDEYSIVMDAMPADVSPEQYLRELTEDLNKAVHSNDFDDINTFERTGADKRRGGPAVGDVYDIDIRGPENGSVMLIESTPTRFIFQTVTVPQTGTHPENGSREFGFERLADGSVRWYTRGVSRPSTELVRIVGGPAQKTGWTAMLTGIGNALKDRGGRLRAGSFKYWIQRG